MKVLASILFFFGVMGLAQAQHHGVVNDAHHDSSHKEVSAFVDIFTQAHLHGHVRNYFMSTINEGGLKDYYSNATGGAIAMTTQRYKGFEFGVKGLFTYQTFSSDLNEADPTTSGISKWEHELYDIEDLNNFKDLDRLEELYITYFFKGGKASLGKFEFSDTPLINESDGRMKPFVFKGASIELDLAHQQSLKLSALHGVSPRSTVEWYNFNDAIGLVNNGTTIHGTPADYHEETHSRGALVLDYQKKWKHIDLKFYNWYLDRIHNSSWIETALHKDSWSFGIQGLLQVPLVKATHLVEEQYMHHEELGTVVSSQLCKEMAKAKWSVAYTHAFDTGRFLFPKALGRDQFYTSISRSRLEGLGDVDVITLRYQQGFKKKALETIIECTGIFGAEKDDPRFNKYGIDDYVQLNARLNYHFHGFLEGLDMAILYVAKQNLHQSTPDEVYNVSNYQQINFVTNFNF